MSDRREFVQLAQSRTKMKSVNGRKVPTLVDTLGWWWSEKLDGQRCIWDGGVTRGLPKSAVPWANCAKDTLKVLSLPCTGLWSRYGNVIYAPDWYLDGLPSYCLDGELYMGKGTWGKLREIVSRLPENCNPEDWRPVNYVVFDAPHPDVLFKDGRISCPQFNKELLGCVKWVRQRGADGLCSPQANYAQTFMRMQTVSSNWPSHVRLHSQSRDHEEAKAALQKILDTGGEGIMWRNPAQPYFTNRTKFLLKEKGYEDSEGVVIGWVTGKGKLAGLIGAAVVHWTNPLGQDITFELSGFTDAERTLTPEATEWALANPGQPLPNVGGWHGTHLRFSTVVNFRYRTISEDGLPIEARYLRTVANTCE